MERLRVTEPNDLTTRIAQLRARLTPEGTRFFDEYERRSDAVATGETTDLDHMNDQAWVMEQLPTLSAYDREIVMRAMQLHALKVFGLSSGEEIVEELVEKAQKDPERARELVAQAEQLQMYAGEPLQPDMDVREAGDVLKRLLLDPDL